MTKKVEKIAVLGSGTMGHGISEVAALSGFEVAMRDIEEDIVEDGYENIEWSLDKLVEKERISEEESKEALDRIETFVDLEEAVVDADLIIEAAPEDLDIKRELFSDIDSFVSDSCILATNTSSLPITEIAEALEDPSRFGGMHFFNPVVRMDLVEIIYGEETTDETAETLYDVAEQMGKTPIYVCKDVRGFVVNNILDPFINEAAWMVSNDEAEIKQADAAMVDLGYPMGPFELADMTGIDIQYEMKEEAGEEIPPILEEKFKQENLGKKTGRGFYSYENGGANYKPEDKEGFDTLRIEARMVNKAAKLIEQDAANPEDIDTAVKLGAGFPEGICRKADKIGIDKIVEKLEELYSETENERYKPSNYLVDLVENGYLGKDSGRGFYNYQDKEKQSFNTIDIEWDGSIAKLSLDRPHTMNTLNKEVLEELDIGLEQIENKNPRCLVITGKGDRAFCAGADVQKMKDMDNIEATEFSNQGKKVFNKIEEFSCPVIAAIDGYCLGGGLELALSTDIRIATKRSEFGSPEVNLGLIPGWGATQRLPEIVGDGKAREMILIGDRYKTEKMEKHGLINKVAENQEFEEKTKELAQKLSSKAPIAQKLAKKAITKGQDNKQIGYELESQSFGNLFQTEDLKEGINAFTQDRKPEFTGE